MATDGLGGVLPAMVTPLTPDREVDDAGVDALVARALAEGASGVLVAGTTGEGSLLEPDQRVRLTRRARAAIDGAGQVVAGATGATVADLHADVERLAGAGADRVLVLAPSTYPLTPEELVDLHLDVAEHAGAPTLVYHIPQLTGSALTPTAVEELAAHANVVGMKDSSPDADRRAAFVDVVGHLPTFDVLTGHAPTLRAALEAGVSGSITAVANVRLWQVAGLHDAVAAGDPDRAARLQAGLARLSEGIATVGASVPAVLKAALQLDGIIADRWCRPPLRSVAPGHLDRVRTVLMP